MLQVLGWATYLRTSILLFALLMLSVAVGACGESTNTAVNATSTLQAGVSGNPQSGTSNLKGTLRLGFFPNLTHAQALVGIGNGTFATVLGSGVKLETRPFNAGPAAVEAMLAGELDLAYLGPNPAINAYVKTQGQGVRVIAGAVSGGASLVVRADVNITNARDFAGKKIASPQFANTQDVALRTYIIQAGLKTKDQGGEVEVVPTDNANILQLFQNKQIDGAWVAEPWATRLITEAHGRRLLDEKSLWPEGKFVTTNLLVSTKFLNEKPELLKAFLDAHVQATQFIQQNPTAAKKILNDQLKALSGKGLEAGVLDQSFSNLEVTIDPLKSTLLKSADNAFNLGFLGKQKPNLDRLYDLKLLNSVLTEKGLATIN